MEKNIASQIDGFIGNVIQIPRALHYLIIAAGEYIMIEKEDDVSVLDNNKKVLIIEQVKDRGDKNIYTNSSEDLWKTIYNWAFDWVHNNSKFTDNTRFIIYSRKKGLKKDTIVEKIEKARTPKEIAEAYEFIKLNYLSASKNNKEKYRPFILDDKNKEIICKIIRNFECSEPNLSLIQDLEDTFNHNLSYFGENVNIYRERIFSWFAQKIMKDETKINKEIEYSKTYLNSYIGELLNMKNLIPLAFEQDIPAYNIENFSNCNFVKQLNFIDLEDDTINNNIKDFLIWDTTLNQDAVKGRLTEDLLNTHYKEKHSKWKEDKEWIYRANHTEKDELKGMRLYRETITKETRIGNLVFSNNNENQVTRGISNHLANLDPSDIHSIGWHPNYVNKLNKEDIIE